MQRCSQRARGGEGPLAVYCLRHQRQHADEAVRAAAGRFAAASCEVGCCSNITRLPFFPSASVSLLVPAVYRAYRCVVLSYLPSVLAGLWSRAYSRFVLSPDCCAAPLRSGLLSSSPPSPPPLALFFWRESICACRPCRFAAVLRGCEMLAGVDVIPRTPVTCVLLQVSVLGVRAARLRCASERGRVCIFWCMLLL